MYNSSTEQPTPLRTPTSYITMYNTSPHPWSRPIPLYSSIYNMYSVMRGASQGTCTDIGAHAAHHPRAIRTFRAQTHPLRIMRAITSVRQTQLQVTHLQAAAHSGVTHCNPPSRRVLRGRTQRRLWDDRRGRALQLPLVHGHGLRQTIDVRPTSSITRVTHTAAREGREREVDQTANQGSCPATRRYQAHTSVTPAHRATLTSTATPPAGQAVRSAVAPGRAAASRPGHLTHTLSVSDHDVRRAALDGDGDVLLQRLRPSSVGEETGGRVKCLSQLTDEREGRPVEASIRV
jgi:hypothetical protein